MEKTEEQNFKSAQFNIPASLFNRMVKLSKIRNHSINDEFVEALDVHMKEVKDNLSSSKDTAMDSLIEEQFEKNPVIKKAFDKEVVTAVEKHLKRYVSLIK